MADRSGINGALRFADYEANPSTQELRKRGVKVRLEVQPFQVLLMLLERQGEVVTRDELKQSLWANDTFVDFDSGVNQAIRKIRRALDDSATEPQFVETLPRRGYRFVAPVELPAQPPSLSGPPAIPASDSLAELAHDPPRGRIQPLSYAGAAVGCMFAAFLIYLVALPEINDYAPEIPERRFSLEVPDLPLEPIRSGLVQVSPDGNRVAYITGDGIGIWDLTEEPTDRRLNGTSGAGQLAWAPDSESIAFRTTTAVKLADTRGAPPRTLWEGENFALDSGAIAWNEKGDAVSFSRVNSGRDVQTVEVPRVGGVPQEKPAPAATFGFAPRFLPARYPAFLYETSFYPYEKTVLLQRSTGEPPQPLGKGWNPWFSPTGHVLFESLASPKGIWATPFSPEDGRHGKSFPVVPNARSLSLSDDGATLVYAEIHREQAQLLLLNRSGHIIEPIGAPQLSILRPDLSPDGRRVAVWGWEEHQNGDIWIHEVDQPSKSLLTRHAGMDLQPVWSPDQTKIAFTSDRTSNRDLWLESVDRSEPAKLLLSAYALPQDWSHDGKYLLFLRVDKDAAQGLWYLDMESKGAFEAKPFRTSKYREHYAAFSPDGRYVAFVSNDTGYPEVYVCSFPECREERKVSLQGGMHARWAKGAGGSIYYVRPDDMVMEVRVLTQPALRPDPPRPLFEFAGLYGGHTAFNRNYDVTDDGQRFVVVKPGRVKTEPPPTIHLWQNWYAGLEERELKAGQ